LQPVYELEYIGHRQTNGAHAARLFEICQQMNNNNLPALFRSLIVYAVCIPLAMWVGYLLTQLDDRSTYETGGILLLILCAPILLRWHHLLLIASWNFSLMIFFLPGSPFIWLPMACLSLGISVLQRTLNSQARFISAPQITWPLICLLLVVLFTAQLTGGIGLRSMGSEVMGGKRYVLLLMGILGYFAISAKRIPPQRAGLYLALFFLGSFTNAIGDLAGMVPRALYPIFAFFPVSGYNLENDSGAIEHHARYAGLGAAGMGAFFFMLARYGVRGIFVSNKPWRWLIFCVFSILIFFGGFRSSIILCGMMFFFQFFMERAHRTRVFPVFICLGIIGITLIIPFAGRLPYTIQRSLAFLPLNIDSAARVDAEGSSDWRIEVWKEALPEVPTHLLLGKGYALSQLDMQTMDSAGFQYASVIDSGIGIAGNYHSGPLSLIIPFGIWGVIVFIWFWIACGFALYANYRHGPPELRTANIFLLSSFIAHVILYLFVFGGFYSDMQVFAGIIGLSVSLNGGICKPAAKPVLAATTVPAHAQPRFQSFFPAAKSRG
jgi:hypothetical protein